MSSEPSDVISSESSESECENKAKGYRDRTKYNEYMKNYMREYRKKHRQQNEERSHCCKIRNQLMKETVVEGLLTKAIQTLIKIINKNSDANRVNLENYFGIIIDTVDELINISEN